MCVFFKNHNVYNGTRESHIVHDDNDDDEAGIRCTSETNSHDNFAGARASRTLL